MKMSIKKLVAGSLVCAVAAGSAPFFNASPMAMVQVQAASQETQDNVLQLQEELYGDVRKLDADNSVWIYKGLGTTLKISSDAENVKNITCSFESSDSSIFTIDKDGVITPKSVGDAILTIHAKTEDGKEQTSKQKIEVVDYFVCGDMAYGMVSDNEFEFLQASYDSKDITRVMIPHTINNDVIKVIGKGACAGYKYIKLIEVPDTVTTIKERAFTNDPSLEFVMLPKSVTKIADNAFGDGVSEDNTKKIVIKGYKGSEAEKFAKAHEDIVTFEEIKGDYIPYKYVYSMKFTTSDSYRRMKVNEKHLFSVNTTPQVVDEQITFTSEDPSVVSVTSGGAAIAKQPGIAKITATSTTGVQTSTFVYVSDPEPTATPTVNPTQTPNVATTPAITATILPTTEPHETPFVEVFVNFMDGDGSQTQITRPQSDGEVTYVAVTIPAPMKEREGYRFLGWQNKNKLYQPNEMVKLYSQQECTFYAKWEKIEPTATPVVTSAAVTGSATTTPVVTIEPSKLPMPVKQPMATETPVAIPRGTSTPIVTPVTTPMVTKLPEFPQETVTATPSATKTPEKTENETSVSNENKEQGKKASLKIITSTNKKFTAGKKYKLKAKLVNTKKKMKWAVSNKKIATINAKTGVLKTKKAGKVTITVTCGKLKKKMTIRVS